MKLLTCWTLFLVSTAALIEISHLSQSSQEENCNTIEAAFSLPNGEGNYFLSAEEYIEYNFILNSEAKVGPITELGLDSRVYHASASFRMADGRLVFLKGCDYFIYTVTEGSTLTLSTEGSNFGGLPCCPDAALNLAEDILVFKGCDVWKFSNATGTFQPDGGVAERGLPCDMDAAVDWHPEEAIVIKGSHFWKLDFSDIEGPLHTDALGLCSWYVCGEASWMVRRNRGRLYCNGDRRLCALRLDQVTLPGLHNAGSGFDGSQLYGLTDCWARNHARSILEQLQLGIRHLDIDPSYFTCGALGSHHSLLCGGSICRIVKQVRTFLSQSPHAVITLNFNHEMKDPEKVIPALTRQLKTQLGPMLNNRFRISRRGWPKLRQAVRTNRRVFVFYGTPFIHSAPYQRRFFQRYKWIHTEAWMKSTWEEFFIQDGNCSAIVAQTRHECLRYRNSKLLEVSMIPTLQWSNPLFGESTCVTDTAEMCRHHVHQSLRACQPYRFGVNKSPNILLVDYPENSANATNSVFHAVRHQNVRNLHAHLDGVCEVKIDAAVTNPASADQVLFFVRSKVIIYRRSHSAQINEIKIPNVWRIDAAYVAEDGSIVLIKDCQSLHLDGSSLQPLSGRWSAIASCGNSPDAAEVWDSTLHVFQGCHLTAQDQSPQHLSQYGLPCDVDAALAYGTQTFVFKGNRFWFRNSGQAAFTEGGETLDWTIDAVVC